MGYLLGLCGLFVECSVVLVVEVVWLGCRVTEVWLGCDWGGWGVV